VFFGSNASGKGWRETVRSILAGEVEILHEQSNCVFQVVQLLGQVVFIHVLLSEKRNPAEPGGNFHQLFTDTKIVNNLRRI
jgi:hypothetical protein